MTVLLVVLLAGVLLATLGARKEKTGPPRTGTNAPGKPRAAALSPYWLIGAVLLGFVLLRFGVNWLVVVGGMVLAVLRSVVPLLRFLPFLQSFRRSVSAPHEAGPSSARTGAPHVPPPRTQRMTRQEALQVFGLDDKATREDVQREYRRLMRKVHPDLGGSSYLAAKINEAKDVLS